MTNGESFRTEIVQIAISEGVNVVLGQSHFIKTVEDLYEALITASPSIKFGIAFCEASGKRLIRCDGNAPELITAASHAAEAIGCGHTFIVYMRDAFPINVLNRIKSVQEVCHIYCATANPLQVIIADSTQGRGVLGVIDGQSPLNIENEADRAERTDFVRRIGYKR